MKKILGLLIVLLILSACQSDSQKDWSQLDLLEYGVPLTIAAPDSVKVEKMSFGSIQDDITIVDEEENYSIQIYASDANTNDIAKVKADQLSSVKTNRYFSKIVEEEEQGFIYETAIDSIISYGFRHIEIQGDREYIFQTGLIGTFTLEEVKRMYDAVKLAE